MTLVEQGTKRRLSYRAAGTKHKNSFGCTQFLKSFLVALSAELEVALGMIFYPCKLNVRNGLDFMIN